MGADLLDELLSVEQELSPVLQVTVCGLSLVQQPEDALGEYVAELLRPGPLDPVGIVGVLEHLAHDRHPLQPLASV